MEEYIKRMDESAAQTLWQTGDSTDVAASEHENVSVQFERGDGHMCFDASMTATSQFQLPVRSQPKEKP